MIKKLFNPILFCLLVNLIGFWYGNPSFWYLRAIIATTITFVVATAILNAPTLGTDSLSKNTIVLAALLNSFFLRVCYGWFTIDSKGIFIVLIILLITHIYLKSFYKHNPLDL